MSYAKDMHESWKRATKYAVEDQPTRINPLSPEQRVSLTPPPVRPYINPEEPHSLLKVGEPLASWEAHLPHPGEPNQTIPLRHQMQIEQGLHKSGPVYRWAVHHPESGETIHHGDWTPDQEEAEREGISHARSQQQPPKMASLQDHPTKQGLQEGRIISRVRLKSGQNQAHYVALDNGHEGIWKAEKNEDHTLRDTIPGDYWRREVAASEIADELGLSDLVPKTVARHEENEGHGSLQDFVHNAKDAIHFDGDTPYNGPEDRQRSAAFDFLLGNSDRHLKNWMLKPSSEGWKIALIDNGMSFPHALHGEPHEGLQGGKSFLLEEAIKRHEPIPREVEQWGRKRDSLVETMKRNGLSPDAIQHTLSRLDLLVQAAKEGKTFEQLAREFDAPIHRHTLKAMQQAKPMPPPPPQDLSGTTQQPEKFDIL